MECVMVIFLLFKLRLPLLLALLGVRGTVPLECYRCSDVQNIDDCKFKATCAEGQVCYKRREFTNTVQFDLGCIDKERCGEYAKIQNGSDNAKMSADKTSYCYECCSKDGCNTHLCKHKPQSLCQDDKSLDCALLNSMFSICKVKGEAKKICPKYCNLCNLVDGKWSPWSPWSSCDVTCGKGSLLRHRLCNNPAPQNGGLKCPGKGTEIKTCRLKLCPVSFVSAWRRSVWGNWGKCSATCGSGMRNRKRSCTNPRPQRFGDHCFGDSTGYELCSSGFCAGDWSNWSNWEHCSVSCGVGLQSRSRYCKNTTPENVGYQCFGQNMQDRLCYLALCEAMWGHWQGWSKCSVECGRGIQTRKRICNKDLFTGNCKGNATDKKACKERDCTDCYDIKTKSGKENNGVHNVTLWKTKKTIPVYCDFDTDKGGWTVFQYRFNGSVDFNRKFAEYKTGFGSLDGEFWLGLNYIYEMVSQEKTELRIDFTTTNDKTAYETFQNFQLEQGPYFTLRIDKGVGTAGDGIYGLSYHNGQKFSTYDLDQDAHSLNCAAICRGGWWYNACDNANLNAAFSKKTEYYSFSKGTPLKVTRMMFRRV